MCPEQAKVFVAEDSCALQQVIKMTLEDAGHEVVLSATNLDDALAATGKLVELGVQVAILDGNLSKHRGGGQDGQDVLVNIRNLAPQIKTIGFSSDAFEGVDIDLGKDNAGKLTEVVTNL